MPSLDALQSMDHLKNLKIFPINIGQEKIEKAEKFFSELKVKNLDLYFDNSAKLTKSFSLRGVPTSIIINKNGKEFARIMGSIDFGDKKFVEWLSKYN
jgi:thioredoxin-related protein